jgi:hypothetical protein
VRSLRKPHARMSRTTRPKEKVGDCQMNKAAPKSQAP